MLNLIPFGGVINLFQFLNTQNAFKAFVYQIFQNIIWRHYKLHLNSDVISNLRPLSGFLSNVFVSILCSFNCVKNAIVKWSER